MNARFGVALLLTVVLFAAAACSSVPPQRDSTPATPYGALPTEPTPVPDSPPREMVSVPAPVESVKVVTSDTDPADVSLVVLSLLPRGSSCSEFEEFRAVVETNRVVVTMTNLEVAPGQLVPCTADLPIVETTIPLRDTLTPGQSYKVIVNGQLTNEFTARGPEAREMAVVLAPIETLEILVMESFPPQYSLEIISRLPRGSSCSQHYGYDVTRRLSNSIEVTVTNLEVTADNVPCTLDLPLVRTTIPLGSDFQSGETYTVIVNNDVTEEFVAQ